MGRTPLITDAPPDHNPATRIERLERKRDHLSKRLDEAMQVIGRLQIQRDELLAACKTVYSRLGDWGFAYWGTDEYDLCDVLKTAIAAVEVTEE